MDNNNSKYNSGHHMVEPRQAMCNLILLSLLLESSLPPLTLLLYPDPVRPRIFLLDRCLSMCLPRPLESMETSESEPFLDPLEDLLAPPVQQELEAALPDRRGHLDHRATMVRMEFLAKMELILTLTMDQE